MQARYANSKTRTQKGHVLYGMTVACQPHTALHSGTLQLLLVLPFPLCFVIANSLYGIMASFLLISCFQATLSWACSCYTLAAADELQQHAHNDGREAQYLQHY